MSFVLGFLLTWLIIFAVSFIVTEFGQNYLYEETTPHTGWKVLGGSAVLAILATWTKASFDTMFTSHLGMTIVLAIAAFAIFTLVYRFHPWHAAAIGIPTVILLAAVSTLAIDSFENRTAATLPENRTSKPVRVQVGPSGLAQPSPKEPVSTPAGPNP